MTPRASILLPVYNAAATLEVCLRSIQRQTEPNFEVLVVDDGSVDNTASLAQEFARRDARFRVIGRDHHGLVAALNAGIAQASAEVVVRMDGDDIMHRHRLTAQLTALEDPALSAVGCHVRLFPRARLGKGLRAYERWLNSLVTPDDIRRDAFIECPIAHPTLTIRTRVLQALQYRDRGWPEDYDLVLRLLQAGHQLAVVPRRLHLWRNDPGRLSRTDDHYSIDAFTACRAHFLSESFIRDDYVLWGFGHTGKALRAALAAAGKTVSAIVDVHPGRLGQVIHGAPVIPPDALPCHSGVPILVSVAGASARKQIRQALAEMRFLEHRDFVLCA